MPRQAGGPHAGINFTGEKIANLRLINMAAEPEKKIDELLQAYARKRREDAGEPLDLHPATRRILQGEVAKLRAGKARESRPWWQSLLLVWPRFAAAFAIFMMLALGVWVFV